VKQFLLLFVVVAACLAGCAPKTLSFRSSLGSGGGRGYLVFRKPDRSHLIVLSPFGATVMEAFTSGDRLTIVFPSKELAYAGTFDELPAKAGLQGWKALRWLMDGEQAGKGEPNGEAVRVNREGKRETVRYNDAGLVVGKLTEEGDEVVYRDYRSVEGAPFPSTIEFRDKRGTTLKIGFDEPEINKPVAESALQPRLDGITVLSLKRLGVE
jgi:Outer membrane lipoprotein LolB